MSLNYKALGVRIKGVREKSMLSQATLAEIVDLSPSYISYIECGTKHMRLETFVKIANALEASPTVLLTEQLHDQKMTFTEELALLLNDCNEYERIIILESAKTLKVTMRESRPLLHRIVRW